MMKMLETQVAQFAGRLSSNEEKLPGQPQSPKTAKAIQTRSGKETEEPEHAAGARKPKPRVEVETICNTRFIKGHKPSNHIRARIKSHVYTTE